MSPYNGESGAALAAWSKEIAARNSSGRRMVSGDANYFAGKNLTAAGRVELTLSSARREIAHGQNVLAREDIKTLRAEYHRLFKELEAYWQLTNQYKQGLITREQLVAIKPKIAEAKVRFHAISEMIAIRGEKTDEQIALNNKAASSNTTATEDEEAVDNLNFTEWLNEEELDLAVLDVRLNHLKRAQSLIYAYGITKSLDGKRALREQIVAEIKLAEIKNKIDSQQTLMRDIKKMVENAIVSLQEKNQNTSEKTTAVG